MIFTRGKFVYLLNTLEGRMLVVMDFLRYAMGKEKIVRLAVGEWNQCRQLNFRFCLSGSTVRSRPYGGEG